jgi:hypothetical protein
LAIAANMIGKKGVDRSLRALLGGQMRAVLVVVPDNDTPGLTSDHTPIVSANTSRIDVAAIDVRHVKSAVLVCQPTKAVPRRTL